MAKAKTVFYCTECGNETAKWAGKCPACGAWNTIEEHIAAEEPIGKKNKHSDANKYASISETRAKKISDISFQKDIRFLTGLGEFDRVLGGGLVEGSVVLISGEPGIGKSTILLQMMIHLQILL